MKETKQIILFYCDADRVRGMGHLFRCRMLYGNLAGPGSLLAVTPDSAARGFLDSSELPWREISPRLAGGGLGLELARIAGEINARAVLLDSKDNARELVLALRRQGLLVVDLDDMGPGRLEADILVDPNIQPGSLEAAYSGRAACCFGPVWALLDPGFAALRVQPAQSGPTDNTDPLRVVVSLGGSDPSGLTGHVLKVLSKVDRELEIEVVLGPAMDAATLPDKGRHSLRVHHGLSSLAELLACCSVAFVSGGITMFEALSMGAATVVVPQHEEQYTNASRLAHRDALLVVPPPAEENSLLGLELTAREVIENESLRGKLAASGAALVDGQGVKRLRNKLQDLLSRNRHGSIAANAV